MRLTVARIGYMLAARNQPERPNAMPTSTQRTIGTGITQSTYIEKENMKYCCINLNFTYRDRYPDKLAVAPYRNCFYDAPFTYAKVSQS